MSKIDMQSVFNQWVATAQNTDKLLESIVGYSTDPKPTVGIKKGAAFLELDTKDVYIYDGTKWVVF